MAPTVVTDQVATSIESDGFVIVSQAIERPEVASLLTALQKTSDAVTETKRGGARALFERVLVQTASRFERSCSTRHPPLAFRKDRKCRRKNALRAADPAPGPHPRAVLVDKVAIANMIRLRC